MASSVCIICEEVYVYKDGTAKGLYCSQSCSGHGRFKDSIEKFLDGALRNRQTLRKVLAHLRGYKCEVCGIAEWLSKPITLQLDHKDGRADNNRPENVRLICPNCHSQTETWCGRNVGNGRKAIGLKQC